MSRRRGATAIASNPVLVGVATTLVIVVAVFLAYNANAGLPWVPTYRLTAEVPIATSLVKGNEARIGGLRVGVVDKITPVQHDDGSVMAKLDLKLETRIKPLPVDSTIMVRPRSALGLKYIEITRGDSARGFPEGGTIPLENADRHAGRVRRVLRHVGPADARRPAAQPARLRRRLRGSRRGPERGDPGVRPAGRQRGPGADEHRRPRHALAAVLRVPVPGRDHRRSGRGRAGAAVGEPRPHDLRLRRRGAALPAGDDPPRPGGDADRDRDVPADPAVLPQHR